MENPKILALGKRTCCININTLPPTSTFNAV